jgi:hypothetical protein
VERLGHPLDIRFWREGGEMQFEVLKRDPKAEERGRLGAQF